jgi:hypothetical protein
METCAVQQIIISVRSMFSSTVVHYSGAVSWTDELIGYQLLTGYFTIGTTLGFAILAKHNSISF